MAAVTGLKNNNTTRMEVGVGNTTLGEMVTLDARRLATSGTAILAMRGAGKSWLNSILAEGLIKAGVPIVIIDPEGEYWTLKVAFENLAVAGGEHADLPLGNDIAGELAQIAIHERIPLVIDLSDVRRSEQFTFLALFLEELFFFETTARIPLWISFEEADLWAPQKSEPVCKSRVLDICQRGRKRGLGFSLVSQRPATLDKTALSQAEFRFFKRFQQPHDLQAIAEYLGPFDKLVSTLPELNSSDALFYAPTEFKSPKQVTIVDRVSPHGGVTPEQIAMVRSSSAISALKERLEMLMNRQKEEQSLLQSLRVKIKGLEDQLNSKEREIQKTKAALELAATFGMVSSSATKPLVTDVGIGIKIDGLDSRTGKINGNPLGNLLLNELKSEERAVLLTLMKSKKPMNVKELTPFVDYGRDKIASAIRHLERKGVIHKTKLMGKGKFYLANTLT